MKLARDYRLHAQECRALARSAQNEEQRTQLLKMAEAWENFALERERMVSAQNAAMNIKNDQ